METRKVQITGGSTFMVTLPKRWANKVGLEAGSKIRILNATQNSLLLLPDSSAQDNLRVGVIKLGEQDGAPLTRNVISLYIAGYEVMKIEGKQISSSQRSTIRKATQTLIGPEIIEESSHQIVIKNLSDLSELSIKETLVRIHQISRSMFEDAIKALLAGNKELAADVRDRDDDVDRLFLAIARRFRIMLYDIVEKNEEEINKVEYFDYQTAAKQLERIADHSCKIADIVPSLKFQFSDELSSKIQNASQGSTSIMDKALKALTEIKTNLANEALNQGTSVDANLLTLNKSLHDLDAPTSQKLGIVADSVDRVKEYGINIAETALNSSCPLPGK